MATDDQGARSAPGLVQMLFGRRVISEHITSAALLGGIVAGGLIGGLGFQAWLAGFWIGVACGLVLPRLTLGVMALSGRVPTWALYRSRRR